MHRRIRSIIPHVPRTGTGHARLLPSLVLGACVLGGCSSAVDDVTAAITPTPATTSAATLAPRQDPAIAIETPLDDGEVSTPVSVTGTAGVAGAQVTVRVLDHDGFELAAIEAEVDCEQACPGTFSTEVFFFVQRRDAGWVEVSGETDHGLAVLLVPVVLFPVR
jgi:Immunoglobulin-like domain of bacterial spore germination